jgi:hypothetical protein
MDYNFLRLLAYLLCIIAFLCGLGCANYLFIAITNRSFINHKILFYIIGILGIVFMLMSIIGFMNIKLIL